MTDYRSILKRIGIVLLVVGLLDFGYSIYCIANDKGGSVTVNIGLIVAAIFLIRGGLQTARYLTSLSALAFATSCGFLLVVMPLEQPLDLWLIDIKLFPSQVFLQFFFSIAFVALTAWVYLQLRRPPVVAARTEAGQKAGPPRFAFGLGIFLVVASIFLTKWQANSENAQEAVKIAQVKYGTDYKYMVSGMSYGGDAFSADLTAYNEHEVKQVHVDSKDR